MSKTVRQCKYWCKDGDLLITAACCVFQGHTRLRHMRLIEGSVTQRKSVARRGSISRVDPKLVKTQARGVAGIELQETVAFGEECPVLGNLVLPARGAVAEVCWWLQPKLLPPGLESSGSQVLRSPCFYVVFR